jgi:hypothetical protein
VLLLLVACVDLAPTFVSKGDIDKAIGTRNETVLCTGLTMKEEETRSYAAEKIVTLDKMKSNCLCEHPTYQGHWDAAILQGARKAKEDARAGCLATLLDDPAQTERPALATALLDVKVPAVRARLVTAATSDADPAVQAAALPILTGTKDPAEVQLLAGGLATKPTGWVLSATRALAGQAAAAPALKSLATTHADPAVRAAALDAYRQDHTADFAEVVCAAMLKDADATVRTAAITMVKSSRDAAVLGCLRERAMTVEPDAGVRLALLQTLSRTGAPEAADILCDTVPFWVKTYVKDVAVAEKSPEDILYFQNDRDFERSYECAEKAYRAGGYSCWGKAYVGARFAEFGGKASYPKCGGGGAAASGGGGEISF